MKSVTLQWQASIRVLGYRRGGGRSKGAYVVGIFQNAYSLLFLLSLLHINLSLSLSLLVNSTFSLPEVRILKMGTKSGSVKYKQDEEKRTNSWYSLP